MHAECATLILYMIVQININPHIHYLNMHDQYFDYIETVLISGKCRGSSKSSYSIASSDVPVWEWSCKKWSNTFPTDTIICSLTVWWHNSDSHGCDVCFNIWPHKCLHGYIAFFNGLPSDNYSVRLLLREGGWVTHTLNFSHTHGDDIERWRWNRDGLIGSVTGCSATLSEGIMTGQRGLIRASSHPTWR